MVQVEQVSVGNGHATLTAMNTSTTAWLKIHKEMTWLRIFPTDPG